MRILIHGSTGRMGKILCDLLQAGYPGLELTARVSPEETADPANCVYTSLQEVTCEVDGVIDFSHHTAVDGLMDFCTCKNLPVVVATTGHTAEEKAIIAEAAKKIDMSNISDYDQGLNEAFQQTFHEYFEGNVDMDTALENFYTSAVEKYPELTK